MARSSRHRSMPSTPQDRPTQDRPTPPAPPSQEVGGESVPLPATPAAAPSPSAPVPGPRPVATEKAHVLAGTGCSAGHQRGQELDAGRLGAVPSQKRTRIGFALVLWCVGGIGVLAAMGFTSWTWAELSIQVTVLWLAFAAFVVRRAGHRGRCWRTRTWRHAWGGLAPGS